MAASPTTVLAPKHGVRPALTLLLARLLLVALVTVLTWSILSAGSENTPFPPSPMVATLGLVPVNIASLLLATGLLRRDGQPLRGLFGYRKGDWLRDTAWGCLWVAVLFLSFVTAIFATLWLLRGSEVFRAFETVFYNPEAALVVSPGVALAIGAIAVLTFAPLNAPAEEIVFRGYAQSRLANAWPTAAAVVVPSLALACSTHSSRPPRMPCWSTSLPSPCGA